MKYIIFITLMIISFICYADTYMKQEENGNIIYSDVLFSGAEKINLDHPQTSSSSHETTSSSSPTTHTTEQSIRKPYQVFSIASPSNQTTFQNQPTIAVTIKVEPALQKGDQVQIFLDGKPLSHPEPSTQFKLDHINRGTHQLYAILLDSNGAIIKQSEAVTFYVHYAHLGSSLNNKPSSSTEVKMIF